MTPERWAQIEAACQAVLAAPPSGRAAAIERACGGDAGLRSEVEALLQEQARARHFLDTSAWEVAAQAFADEPEAERGPRLRSGARLGPFLIDGLAGVGGMGEVYRATDTRLGRTVAIKVLPPDAAGDAASRRRFETEARTISGLSHPHVCALYDIGTAEPAEAGSESPVDYLVMEYLQGRTLAERMATPTPGAAQNDGPPMPLEEALAYGVQIAGALAAAHARGIVHCDLKPGNVMLTREGVKLLDFGIARMKRAGLAGAPGAAGDGPAQSAPSGGLHGTINYMAPEQFAGKEPDARSDMFAFGALLFEMVTGRRAFDASSPAGVLTAILGVPPPPVSAHQPRAPRALDDLVSRCLAKDPDERWDSARLAADELRRMSSDAPVVNAAAADASADRGARAAARWLSGWRLAAAALALGGLALAVQMTWPTSDAALTPLQRLDLDLGGFEVHPRTAHALLSPDGSRIVYSAADAGGRRALRVRRLDKASPTELYDGAVWPFLSPDGRWVGFLTGGRMYKVGIDGGTPMPVCDAPFAAVRGVNWGDDGTIAFAPDLTGGLMRVPSSGGTPVALTVLDPARKEVTHRWPQILPGSRAVLFTAHSVTRNYDEASIEVQRLDTGERKTLHRGGYNGRYLPSGHLVFVRHATLYAAPMDLTGLELRGPAVPVLDGIVGDSDLGWFEFSASAAGAALCFTGDWQQRTYSPVWYDRSGRAERIPIPLAPYADPRVSPRGRAIAFSIGEQFASRLIGFHEPGLHELRRIPSDRFDLSPIFAPDGAHVVFGRQNDQGVDLCWRRTDGTGPVQRLVTGKYVRWASSFSSDGRELFYTETHPDTLSDIWAVSLDLRDPDHPVVGMPRPILQTAFSEESAAISPDGRWVAYHSLEAHRREIYVRPAAGADEGRAARIQVSRDGGVQPLWVPGHQELLYERTADHALIIVPYRVARGEFIVGAPRPWPGVRIEPGDASYSIRGFDVSPDGDRVLVMARPDPAPVQSRAAVTLLLNFFDELRRRTG
jgi:serine/threonine-protein kinase